jgi:hypothetical protein
MGRLRRIAKEVHVKEVYIPGVGIKDRILLEMIPVATCPALPKREQVWASTVRLWQKYKFDSEHSLLIARLAAKLFNQSLSLHT